MNSYDRASSFKVLRFLIISFLRFRLSSFHKIDIFQSEINRVAVQISLRFQGKKPKSEGNLREISAKSRIKI